MVRVVSSSAEFKTLISGSQKVIVDFTATWCGPCKFIGPKFEAFSEDPKYGAIVFAKVDVDELSDVAEQWGVNAMPTFLVFELGAKVDESVGASESNLLALIEKHK